MHLTQKYYSVFIVIALSVFTILPFFQPGFFPMHDDTQAARVYEMGKSLKDGMFPVRWVQDLGYGYGYPIFNFYSPLPYYIGGFFSLLGINALLATKITFIIGILLAGILMYVFINSLLGRTAALISAIIYTYFPYHAVNIYVRGDLGELYAYAFLPFVFLGFYKIHNLVKTKSTLQEVKKWILLSAIGIFFVIISHNLTSFILLIFLTIYSLLSFLFNNEKLKLILFYFLAMLLGFILSAFYSIPALLEMNFTNISSQIGGGAHFSDHFVCINQLWDSHWGFGGSVKNNCIDGMSFKLGKLNIILLGISLVLFIYLIIYKRIKEDRFLFVISIISLVFSIFMMTSYSLFIWQSLPSMEFLQYPWRFLNFAGLFLSITIAYGIFMTGKLFHQKPILSILFVIIFITLFYNQKLFNPKYLVTTDNNYQTKEINLNWNISKISDEYMPENFKKPKKTSEIPSNKFTIFNGFGDIEEENIKTNLLSAKLNLRSKATIKINTAYFPAWKAYLNGKTIDYQARDNGLYVDVPDGKNLLELKFEETPIEKLSNIISTVGVFLIIIGIIRGGYLKKV